ncbi:MAG: TatD DNase family protein [Thermoproteota archaeon]|jgi:TatD DNase family protein
MQEDKKLIDIHTHLPENKNHFQFKILELSKEDHEPKTTFFIGLHPWYIDDKTQDKEQLFQKLKNNTKHSNFIGLGEVGLDRVCDVNFTLQKETLIKQFEWTKELKINIMSLHLVKSHSDFFEILASNILMPKNIILHDFQANTEILKKYLALISPKRCFYFSFGHRLLSSEKIQSLFMAAPLERVFLETDDQTGISLEEIYQKAAELKSISYRELSVIISGNLNILAEDAPASWRKAP